MVFLGVCGHYLLGTRFPLFFIVRSCYGRHGGADDLKGIFFFFLFFFSFPFSSNFDLATSRGWVR